MFAGRGGVWSINAHRTSEIIAPSRKYLVGDAVQLSGLTASDARHRWHNNSDDLKTSIGYADGHVVTIPQKNSTTVLYANTTLTQPQRDQLANETEYY